MLQAFYNNCHWVFTRMDEQQNAIADFCQSLVLFYKNDDKKDD